MAAMSKRRRLALRAAGIGTATLVLGATIAAAATYLHAGPQGDGTAITPVGYRVTPAGSQTNLGDLPLALRLSPDSKMLLVSNDGQGTQGLQVVNPANSKVVQTIPYASPHSLFVGLAFSPDGSTAYASGGGDEQIHVYNVSGGKLSETTPVTLPATNPSGGKVNMYPAGLQATADGRRLVVADHLADAASVVDLATGQASTVAVGHTPYGVAVTPDGMTAFVSNQGANTVSVLDLSGVTPTVRATVTVGTHPNAEALDAAAHRLYVANGDSDQVSVIDTSTDQVVSTIDLAPYSNANVGTNPTGLTLSPDGRTLYVANSGNNDVDVISVASGQVMGSIPTGWYPSAVATNGSTLFIANAKGLGAGPNDGPGYPNPASTAPTSPNEYVGSMIVGTLSSVRLPLSTTTLADDTQRVAANDGFDRGTSAQNRQPIRHVIYIVKENRTYDQEFGSLGKGNGDPALNLFGDESARIPVPCSEASSRSTTSMPTPRSAPRDGTGLRPVPPTPSRRPCGRPTTPAATPPTRRRAVTPPSPPTGRRPTPTSGTAWGHPGPPSAITASTSTTSPISSWPPTRCSTPTPITTSAAST